MRAHRAAATVRLGRARGAVASRGTRARGRRANRERGRAAAVRGDDPDGSPARSSIASRIASCSGCAGIDVAVDRPVARRRRSRPSRRACPSSCGDRRRRGRPRAGASSIAPGRAAARAGCRARTRSGRRPRGSSGRVDVHRLAGVARAGQRERRPVRPSPARSIPRPAAASATSAAAPARRRRRGPARGRPPRRAARASRGDASSTMPERTTSQSTGSTARDSDS